MTDISSVFRGVLYTVDAAGKFRYTEAGRKAYEPLLKRIGKKPEGIKSLQQHREALDLLKNSAAEAMSGRLAKSSRKR